MDLATLGCHALLCHLGKKQKPVRKRLGKERSICLGAGTQSHSPSVLSGKAKAGLGVVLVEGGTVGVIPALVLDK